MSGSSIKKGAIISYIAIFLNIAITFFYTPWMIRQIGVSDYGLYTLVSSFISYFIMDFGLTQAIQRFIAKYRAESNEDGVAKMIGITTRVYLIIDSIIFLALLVMYFFIEGIFTGLTPTEVERLKGLYIIGAVFSILSFMFKPMGGAMMAYELFVEAKAIGMINRVGSILLICLALLLGANVYALVFIQGAVSLAASVVTFFVFKKKTKLRIQWAYFNRSELKNIFTFSVWTFVTGLAQRLRFTFIPTILGILSNSSEIAIFSLGMALEGMTYTLSAGLNGLFLPKVSRISLSQGIDGVSQLMIRVGRLQLYLISLIFSGFIIFGRQFIQLWVGDGFSNVWYVLLLLIVSNLVSLTQSIAGDYVYVENKIKDTAIRIIGTSALGLCIAAILAPKYGAVGCAIGTGAGLCLYQIIINLFYHKKLKIDVLTFFKKCHISILPALILFSTLSYYAFSLLTINTWPMLITAIIVYTALFILVCRLLLFNEEERQLLKIKSWK